MQIIKEDLFDNQEILTISGKFKIYGAIFKNNN